MSWEATLAPTAASNTSVCLNIPASILTILTVQEDLVKIRKTLVGFIFFPLYVHISFVLKHFFCVYDR